MKRFFEEKNIDLKITSEHKETLKNTDHLLQVGEAICDGVEVMGYTS